MEVIVVVLITSYDACNQLIQIQLATKLVLMR